MKQVTKIFLPKIWF